jgi:hypothetical protein
MMDHDQAKRLIEAIESIGKVLWLAFWIFGAGILYEVFKDPKDKNSKDLF